MVLKAETNEELRSRCYKILRFSTPGTRKFRCIVIGVVMVAFLITWQYRASIGSFENLTSDVNIYKGDFKNFTFLTDEHARIIKNGFGGQIMIEYSDGLNNDGVKNEITLNVVKPLYPKKIEFENLRSKYRATQKAARYVRVYAQYWEQMTMNVRSLITLSGQAKIGGRKVLAPRVKDSLFGPNYRNSLGTYFNLSHFNNILTLSDYATLVSEKEYEAECSLADANHVAVYFLYQHEKERTKRMLHFNKKQYNDMRKLTEKVGWTVCPTLGDSIKGNSNSTYFCVNVSKMTEWAKLEKEVIKGSKCLTISLWRGIGNNFRTHFTQKHLKVGAKDVQFALKPSGHILREAQRFHRVLYGRYIAVQVRGEKVFETHNFSRLRSCLRVLAELVKVLKAVSDIRQVLIASDMSRFGSGAWKKLLKGRGREEHQTLKDLYSFLISSTGGVEYKPTADNVDRGVVALVEMTLIARAQHLITIGKGSFQEWVKAKFLEQHRDDDRPTWSLISMCSE